MQNSDLKAIKSGEFSIEQLLNIYQTDKSIANSLLALLDNHETLLDNYPQHKVITHRRLLQQYQLEKNVSKPNS
jgi:glycine betaine/choline ABC-type transport system substrate-binding protein